MKCIEITAVCKGSNPEIIRKAWIGLRLPVLGPCQSGYAVPLLESIEILRLYRPETAAWWDTNTRVAHRRFFFFDSDSCRCLDALPSLANSSGVSVCDYLVWVGISIPLICRQLVLSPSQFAEFARLSVNPAIVYLIAFGVASEFEWRLESVSTEHHWDAVSHEGHNLLKALYDTAVHYGVAVEFEKVDRPLGIVEAMVKEGMLERVPGGVRLPK